MSISEAKRLINDDNFTYLELVDCLESLDKEYGYVEGMIIAHFRDSENGKKTLAEIQSLIDQLKEKLKIICTN